MTQLTLELRCGETLPRRGEQVHRREPVHQWQLAAVHYRIRLQALAVMAALALEAFLILLPIVLRAATLWTDNALLLPVFPKLVLAAFLIGKLLHKVYKFHCIFVCWDKDTIRLCKNAAQAMT